MKLPLQPDLPAANKAINSALDQCQIPIDYPVEGTLQIDNKEEPATAIFRAENGIITVVLYPKDPSLESLNLSHSRETAFLKEGGENPIPITVLNTELLLTRNTYTFQTNGIVHSWAGYGNKFTRASVSITGIPAWRYPPKPTLPIQEHSNKYPYHPTRSRTPRLRLTAAGWNIELIGPAETITGYTNLSGYITREDDQEFTLDEFDQIRSKLESFLSLTIGDKRIFHQEILTRETEDRRRRYSDYQFRFQNPPEPYALPGLEPKIDTRFYLDLFPAFVEASKNPIFEKAAKYFWLSSRTYIQGDDIHPVISLYGGLESLHELAQKAGITNTENLTEYIDSEMGKEDFPIAQLSLLERKDQKELPITGETIRKYRNNLAHPKQKRKVPHLAKHKANSWLWLRGIAWTMMYHYLKTHLKEDTTLL